MADADSKACTGCGRNLPLTSFHFRKDRGYHATRCRECTAATTRKRYWRDPEKARTKQREYSEAHRDAIRAANRRAYWKFLDKRRARDKNAWASLKADKERLREHYERFRLYRMANPDKMRRYSAAWAARNKDKLRAYSQRNRMIRRAKTRGGVSATELLAWKERQLKVCYWCGKKCARKHTVDHFVPLSKGGRHELDNLVLACVSCNCRKNSKDPEQFRAETWHGTLFSSLIGK